jgi:hypothetical protein
LRSIELACHPVLSPTVSIKLQQHWSRNKLPAGSNAHIGGTTKPGVNETIYRSLFMLPKSRSISEEFAMMAGMGFFVFTGQLIKW